MAVSAGEDSNSPADRPRTAQKMLTAHRVAGAHLGSKGAAVAAQALGEHLPRCNCQQRLTLLPTTLAAHKSVPCCLSLHAGSSFKLPGNKGREVNVRNVRTVTKARQASHSSGRYLSLKITAFLPHNSLYIRKIKKY